MDVFGKESKILLCCLLRVHDLSWSVSQEEKTQMVAKWPIYQYTIALCWIQIEVISVQCVQCQCTQSLCIRMHPDKGGHASLIPSPDICGKTLRKHTIFFAGQASCLEVMGGQRTKETAPPPPPPPPPDWCAHASSELPSFNRAFRENWPRLLLSSSPSSSSSSPSSSSSLQSYVCQPRAAMASTAISPPCPVTLPPSIVTLAYVLRRQRDTVLRKSSIFWRAISPGSPQPLNRCNLLACLLFRICTFLQVFQCLTVTT